MKKSHCCKAPWHWEQLAGIRLYRQVGRLKHYKAMCSACGTFYDNLTAGGSPRLTGKDDQ